MLGEILLQKTVYCMLQVWGYQYLVDCCGPCITLSVRFVSLLSGIEHFWCDVYNALVAVTKYIVEEKEHDVHRRATKSQKKCQGILQCLKSGHP